MSGPKADAAFAAMSGADIVHEGAAPEETASVSDAKSASDFAMREV